jgi:hypothetical protein
MKNNIADQFHSIKKFVLSVYKINELAKYYIKVSDVYQNRYELTLVDNVLDASVLADEQVYELVSDLRSGNKDLSFFKGDRNFIQPNFITEVHVENIEGLTK